MILRIQQKGKTSTRLPLKNTRDLVIPNLRPIKLSLRVIRHARSTVQTRAKVYQAKSPTYFIAPTTFVSAPSPPCTIPIQRMPILPAREKQYSVPCTRTRTRILAKHSQGPYPRPVSLKRENKKKKSFGEHPVNVEARHRRRFCSEERPLESRLLPTK